MTMMTVCVYLPAVSSQNHWRFRSAYVRGTGVYLQLWERWPACTLLRYTGMSTTERIWVSKPPSHHLEHTKCQKYGFINLYLHEIDIFIQQVWLKLIKL